jgi:PPOX class probable F420-dependent enzyme
MSAQGSRSLGVNQRAEVRMTAEEVDRFLHEGGTMTLASMSPDGSIQLVAMFYGFLEGSVAFLTKAKSQKVKNLRRDPRMSVLLEAGEDYQELRGVSLSGHGEVVEDPERIMALGLDLHQRRFGSFQESDRARVERAVYNRVALKLIVEKTVSWDHRKIEAPAWRRPA